MTTTDDRHDDGHTEFAVSFFVAELGRQLEALVAELAGGDRALAEKLNAKFVGAIDKTIEQMAALATTIEREGE